MHGNVCEWISDSVLWTLPEYSFTPDPFGPSSGPNGVIRSGSWRTPLSGIYVRSASRYNNQIGLRENNIGFRLAFLDSNPRPLLPSPMPISRRRSICGSPTRPMPRSGIYVPCSRAPPFRLLTRQVPDTTGPVTTGAQEVHHGG